MGKGVLEEFNFFLISPTKRACSKTLQLHSKQVRYVEDANGWKRKNSKWTGTSENTTAEVENAHKKLPDVFIHSLLKCYTTRIIVANSCVLYPQYNRKPTNCTTVHPLSSLFAPPPPCPIKLLQSLAQPIISLATRLCVQVTYRSLPVLFFVQRTAVRVRYYYYTLCG